MLILLSMSSCLKDDDGNVKINIEEEFNVWLSEDLQEGDNKLIFHIQTIEQLECSNYALAHSTIVDEKGIIVSIDELELDGECDTVMSFVHAEARLGVLSTGSHNMEVNLNVNSIINEGKLNFNNGVYQMDMETTHGFKFIQPDLHAVPDGYFWGYAALVNSAGAEARENFISNLENYTIPLDLSSGYYGHFDLQNSYATLNTDLMNESIPDGAKVFLHKLEGDKSALLAFVSDFQIEQEGRVKVVLFTSEGEVL